MGYLSIENLYKKKDVLNCFALEKIHGTSAHVALKDGEVSYFPGEVDIEVFRALFDHEKIEARASKGETATIYGEAFGGRVQAMRSVYGEHIRFRAFDVRVEGKWLQVPHAKSYANSLGIEFVDFVAGPLTIEFLNCQRDRPSCVGIYPDAPREGIVVRPIAETIQPNGHRWIFKHKRDDFREFATPRRLGEPSKIWTDPKEIAAEWVTSMRLAHVLQQITDHSPGKVVDQMIADITKESAGEIEWSPDAHVEIEKATICLIQDKREPQ